MGASTPSREATGAEEQQIRPKGAVAIVAGRRLIGMGASTPSREATGAEEQQIRPKGAVAIVAGRSVIGVGASTPSRASDRRWGAAKTICRRKELTEV